MKIISWNVNGLNAVVKKHFFTNMQAIAPDVICLQKTKAQQDEVTHALQDLNGYHIYANSAIQKGYASTALLSKDPPKSVVPDMNIAEHDQVLNPPFSGNSL